MATGPGRVVGCNQFRDGLDDPKSERDAGLLLPDYGFGMQRGIQQTVLMFETELSFLRLL